MGLVVYNTLTRTKEPFTPLTPGKVGIYLCGPTVYKPSHIGHAVGPIVFDAIKRFLVHCGYRVTWVVNITDVDDKLIAEAAFQSCTVLELAERITRDYFDAMKKLHVDGIDITPKASEHIGDIINTIERLIACGTAYVSHGDVYFDVTQHPGYGKLSNRQIEDQEGQRDLKSAQKHNPGDFALWKAAKPEEPKEVRFDSPWGPGRPGWHIECSAMAMRYLGETFDIHGGGMDLIFPHHENEVAQSEAANGRPFARFWMHHGLTRINTKKISKSDPEMQAMLAKMTLRNFLSEHSGELLRYFVLSTHYRRPIEYSDAEIESKRKGLDTFYRLFERVERICAASPYAQGDELADARAASGGSSGTAPVRAICDGPTAEFLRAMDDDFNTAGAIAALFDFAGSVNRYIEQEGLDAAGSDSARSTLLTVAGRLIALARVIGLFLEPPSRQVAGSDSLAEKAMQVLIQVRQHLRKKKDFESADLIRNLLAQQKITLEDRPDGTGWRAD